MPTLLITLTRSRWLPVLACSVACSTVRPPAREPSGLPSPCLESTTIFNTLQQRLVEHGYAESEIVMVTDSATCATGIAAHNATEPAAHHVTEAYVIRRGTRGFILVSPADETEFYYSPTWALEWISPSL